MHEELTRRLALRRPPVILNDAVGAIRCGTNDGVGVAAVCGTGGVTGARGRDGEVFHLGFWPDGSGGGFMGDQALRAVWRAALGSGPQTTLTERALQRFGATDPIDLLHLFTRRGGLPESHRALLAPAVLDEAAAGDPVANGIARRAAVTLAGQSRVAAERAASPAAPTRSSSRAASSPPVRPDRAARGGGRAGSAGRCGRASSRRSARCSRPSTARASPRTRSGCTRACRPRSCSRRRLRAWSPRSSSSTSSTA